MVVTMIIVAALLAGAAVLASMQLKSSKGSEITRTGLSALSCAESGIVAARPTVMANYGQWNGSLTSPTEPTWLSVVNHDVDGDTLPDFTITLRDNDDETAPTPNDLTRDNDLTVYIVSTCTKYPDVPTQVSELVRFNGAGNCYQSQLGGCGGNNNANAN
jgi:hypothetical protein